MKQELVIVLNYLNKGGGFRCSSALCLFIFLFYNEPPYGTSFSSFSKFYTWCPLEIGNSEGQILKICLTYLFEVYTCWLHANCHICQISNFAIHTIWDTLYITLRYTVRVKSNGTLFIAAIAVNLLCVKTSL